jgi:hypothetical protein
LGKRQRTEAARIESSITATSKVAALAAHAKITRFSLRKRPTHFTQLILKNNTAINEINKRLVSQM